MKSFFSRSWFTILELVVAVLISFIVLAGISYFFVRINAEMQIADNKTKVYLEISDFIQKANTYTRQFNSGIVLTGVTSSPNYHTLILTDIKNTQWTIIGVVSLTGWVWKLDQNLHLYGEKRLAIRELTKSQVQKIVSNHTFAYTGVVFSEDHTYPYLVTRDLQVTPFNSGAIFDLDLSIYSLYDPGYNGKDVRDLKIQKNTDIIYFNLVF